MIALATSDSEDRGARGRRRRLRQAVKSAAIHVMHNNIAIPPDREHYNVIDAATVVAAALCRDVRE
jgi:hypothetical protein